MEEGRGGRRRQLSHTGRSNLETTIPNSRQPAGGMSCRAGISGVINAAYTFKGPKACHRDEGNHRRMLPDRQPIV